MIPYTRTSFTLCLAFLVLFTFTVAANQDADHLELARARQGTIFADQGHAYRLLSSNPILSTPDFASSAWEEAVSNGVSHSSTQQTPRNSRGKPVPYFFSIIHPGSNLGRTMRLDRHEPVGTHKFASVLWKWQEGGPKMVGVDVIPFEQAVRWPFRDVNEVVRGL